MLILNYPFLEYGKLYYDNRLSCKWRLQRKCLLLLYQLFAVVCLLWLLLFVSTHSFQIKSKLNRSNLLFWIRLGDFVRNSFRSRRKGNDEDDDDDDDDDVGQTQKNLSGTKLTRMNKKCERRADRQQRQQPHHQPYHNETKIQEIATNYYKKLLCNFICFCNINVKYEIWLSIQLNRFLNVFLLSKLQSSNCSRKICVFAQFVQTTQ